MKCRYFQNTDMLAMAAGFMPGDKLRFVLEWNDLSEDYKDICESAFAANNDDLRPRRKEIRSMCIGDVLDVGGIYYKCEVFGFKKMPLEFRIPEIKIDEAFKTGELA